MLVMFSEFYCLGGWEEFVPSLTIEPNYEYYSGYSNPFEVSIFIYFCNACVLYRRRKKTL